MHPPFDTSLKGVGNNLTEKNIQTGFVPTKALPYRGCKKLFSLTFPSKSAMKETKKKGFVSVMRDAIIQASIESLRQEGLKFSVDTFFVVKFYCYMLFYVICCYS